MEKRVVISRLTPRPAWPPNLGGVTVTESISVRSIFFPDTVQLLSLSILPYCFPLLFFSCRKWTPLFLLSSLQRRRTADGRDASMPQVAQLFQNFIPLLRILVSRRRIIFLRQDFLRVRGRKKKRKETRGEKRNEDDPYLLLGCVVILRKQRSSHLNINLKRRSLRIPLCRPRPIQRRIPHRFSSTDISSLRGFAMRHVRPRTSLLYWLIYLRLVFYSVVRGARPTYNLFTHVSRLTTPRLVPLYPFCADYIARSREFDPVFLYVINCYFR